MKGFGYSMCTCRGFTNLKAQSAAAAASFEDCPNSIYERSVDEAYPTPTKPEVAMEEGRTEGSAMDSVSAMDAVSAMDSVLAMDAVDVSKLSMSESAMEEGFSFSEGHDESVETIETFESNANRIQETFVKRVESNVWHNAINFLRQHPQAASASMTDWPYGTALHYAIRKRCRVHIIQQLVELMDNGHLEITDTTGSTALYELIRLFPERVEVAECMVKRNPDLLTILPTGNKKSLVVVAQGKTKGERMARYLYSITPPETIKVKDAAQLISDGFRLQRFDIAWDLIQRYPKLAVDTGHDKNIPLGTLASNRFAFKSGSTLSLWETLIYNG
ncbi:hypothetical protein C1H46_035885 [Malus baccata]|uniref:Uncharacterized protein n=1 Tax=Malus baccata TaxID=106549 RepID=A0A540KWE3_MALBA|nr:hypothetical protein C1H46_035885 [Malus baccata]